MRSRQVRGTLDATGVHALLAALGQPSTPAEHMRHVLGLMRKRGASFDAAWGTGLRSIPRADADVQLWRDALAATKNAWRAAYEHDVCDQSGQNGAPAVSPAVSGA